MSRNTYAEVDATRLDPERVSYAERVLREARWACSGHGSGVGADHSSMG